MYGEDIGGGQKTLFCRHGSVHTTSPSRFIIWLFWKRWNSSSSSGPSVPPPRSRRAVTAPEWRRISRQNDAFPRVSLWKRGASFSGAEPLTCGLKTPHSSSLSGVNGSPSRAQSDTAAEVVTLCEIESHHWRIFPTHGVLSCWNLSRPIIFNEPGWAGREWICSVASFIDVRTQREMFLFSLSPCQSAALLIDYKTQRLRWQKELKL